MTIVQERTATARAAALRRAPIAVKACTALLLLLMIAATPVHVPLLLLLPFGFLTALLVFGRISLLILLKRMAAFEIIAVTTSILALLQPGGWMLFWVLLAKATLSLVTAVVFSLSISFMELLDLLKRLHLPRLFVTTIALLYRYLFVLTDEASRMTRARASRTFAPSTRRTWLLNSGVIGTLALRSVARAENVYNAMRARGWR